MNGNGVTMLVVGADSSPWGVRSCDPSSQAALVRVTEAVFLAVPPDNPLLELSGWAREMSVEMNRDESISAVREGARCEDAPGAHPTAIMAAREGDMPDTFKPKKTLQGKYLPLSRTEEEKKRCWAVETRRQQSLDYFLCPTDNPMRWHCEGQAVCNTAALCV